MSSTQDNKPGFTPTRQLQPWAPDDHSSLYLAPDHRRPSSVAQTEILRPIEPANMQSATRPYLRVNEAGPQRQQLPGLQELLSPPVRTGTSSSSFSSTWPSVNNNTQTSWTESSASSTKVEIPPGNRSSQMGSMPFNPTPPPFHRLSLDVSPADRFTQQPSAAMPLTARSSLPIPPPPPPLRKLSDFCVAHASDQLPPPPQNVEPTGPFHSQASSSFPDDLSDRALNRRLSSAHDMMNMPPASNYSLQCVGQRHIPGEGMCYVFKDGSTCPTIIDGEPVNPLWGTTKAGKARKRLAQACLNCREKKIKCEPGEKSCLQCEKAKRECHRFASPKSSTDFLLRSESRPSVPQLQAELASSISLTVPNPPLGRAEWSSQSSGSVAMTDVPTQKRRRSAQAAQQDVLNLPPTWSRDRSPQSVKRRKSDVSASSVDDFAFERQRKDSKRVDVEDIINPQPRLEKLDPTSWNEDPYRIDPEATIRFLELFFAQSAREVSILFPRGAFTHWVRNCREKCQRECMVLYAVLALGSVFAGNEFSSFAKLCVERAGQAVSRIDGKFSMALIQARLLVAGYYHLIGKDSMGWDLSGSALRVISAMRLNSEEGCGEELDEYTRRYYSFTREQLRECRRRTFWTAFLVDRYHGFCGGLLCAIQAEDVLLRLPCSDEIYEEGSCSDAPFFDCFQPNMGIRASDGNFNPISPAAYTITIAAIWGEVTKLIFRRPNQSVNPRSSTKSHESLADNIQARLFDWKNNLPPHLQYSRQALVEAVQHGYAGSLVSMHALYCISHLKAARNTHHELLSPRTVARHIRLANSHAYQLLQMVCDIRSTKPHGSGKGQDPINLLSPFIAYGTTISVDTISAGGLKEDAGQIISILGDVVAILHDLAEFCASAKTQARQTSKRMAQVQTRIAECFEVTAVSLTSQAANGKGNEDCWKIGEPMEKQFPLQQDVSFGTSPTTYFSALREGR